MFWGSRKSSVTHTCQNWYKMLCLLRCLCSEIIRNKTLSNNNFVRGFNIVHQKKKLCWRSLCVYSLFACCTPFYAFSEPSVCNSLVTQQSWPILMKWCPTSDQILTIGIFLIATTQSPFRITNRVYLRNMMSSWQICLLWKIFAITGQATG